MEQHTHHGHRAKGQGAQLLDRSPGAEDCGQRCPNPGDRHANWSPPGHPQERRRKGDHLQETTGGCATRNKVTGPGAGSRAREVNGAQKDSGKETQAGAEGGQPGWRARKPRKALPGGHTRENSGRTGWPARATQESRQSKHKDRTDPHPLQEGPVAGGQQDSGLAASGQPQAQCTLSSPRAPSFPVPNW